jgi:TRAP-type mannitol/chloroaromatic compound transport system substrate-binding protein
MKLRGIFVIVLALLLGILFTTPSIAAWQEQKPEFVWKCQSGWPRSSGLHYLQMRTLDFIEAWTKGRVKFERYSTDEIVPGYEVWKAVAEGVIPTGVACTCYAMSRVWSSGMYCSSPGLGPVEKLAFYHGTPDVAKTKDFRTPVWKQLEQSIAKSFNGLVVLPSAMQSTETFLYSTKPINSIDDLKKLKIRSVGIRGDVFKHAGVSCVGMPAGEVVAAMDRGVIDGAEFANFFGDIPLGFAAAAKYIYFNPYNAQPSNLQFFINAKEWAKVPPELKKQIEEACFESEKWSLAECLFLDILQMKRAEQEFKAQIAIIPMDVGKYINDKALEFYSMKRKEDPLLDAYMKEYEAFFAPDNYGKYVKFVKSLL